MVAGLALAAPTLSPAQTRPDFSGTWIVETVDAPSRGGGRGGDRQALQPGQRVVISQTEDGMTVTVATDGGQAERSYLFDGSEVSSRGPGDSTVESRSNWEGAALVTTMSVSLSTPRGDRTVNAREERTLGEDGRTMTVTTTASVFRRDRTTTVTLTKAEE